MEQSRALMLVRLDASEGQEDEWNKWYNTRHFFDRMKVPGFLTGRRFIKTGGIPKELASASEEAEYLALYDLANFKVLQDVPYVNLRKVENSRPAGSFEATIAKLPHYARGIYEPIYPEPGKYKPSGSRVIQLVGHDVPLNRRKEYNAWYDTEHTPALMKVPGFLAVRRFVLNERDIKPETDRGGVLSKYVTIWELRDETVLQSAEFRKAANSPWTDWVRSWYTRKINMLYRQIYP
jgi:hypothetical protein